MYRHTFQPLAGIGSLARLRCGLTLVEVLLVLALLVVIGAVSAPMLAGAFSRAGLHSASDVVRAAWSKARLAAMQSGQAHVFRFESNGTRYQIVALDALGLPESSEHSPQGSEAGRTAADMLRLDSNALPEGIVFESGEVTASTQIAALLPEATSGAWSQPIVFHADGTTSNAWVILTNSRQNRIRVTLRGMTGVATVTDVETSPPR